MMTFREIVDTYSSQVYNHAVSLLKNNEEAEEATQDVFLKIHKAIDLFRGDAKLSTWIWRITANVCFTRLAKKRIRTDSLEEMTYDISDGHSFSAEFNRHEQKEIIETMLTRLPPQQASIILLFHIEGKSYKELAETFNLPEGTIATLLYRGRENLRKQLSKSFKEFL
ncbi:MAG: sigma-70 family RNA polymerase sigma factor [Bacteroidetes bacterium]|nr:sigma-70 family RNA polymerase sigma factor [Bacteroidota bacterium]